MANRSKSLIPSWGWPGLIASGLIVITAGLTLGSLLQHTSESDWRNICKDNYLFHIVFFTFWQALLSSMISVLPAILLARALYRSHFPGKQWVLRLCAMTLVLPVLVAVFGLISIYGKQGWLATLCHFLGIEYSFSPYGLQGILLAHLFFNLPLASRLLLYALESIPFEQRQLMAHLGMNSWQEWCIVEWPAVRRQLSPSAALIFMLCFVSFSTVLAMGGGPQATTLELEIYQALSYDYDIGRAALLSLIQLILCLGPVVLAQRFSAAKTTGSSTHVPYLNARSDCQRCRIGDGLIISIALLLLLPPLLAVIAKGVTQDLGSVLQKPQIWQALMISLRVAVGSGLLCVTLTMMLLWSIRELKIRRQCFWSQILELSGVITLAIPNIVLATGFFLLLNNTIGLPDSPYALVIFSNALIALPYALKVLKNPMCDLAERYGPLCLSLNMRGWKRLRLIELKVLRQPIAQALALSCVVSIGDFGIVAVLGNTHFRTLPIYLYQQMGAYRSQDSAATALLLLLLCFLFFTLIERLSGRSI